MTRAHAPQPPLLITATQVARLAKVKRPVVSMWRRRFAESALPFPHPVNVFPTATNKSSGAKEPPWTLWFDAHAVAEWLHDTGHGNNPEARQDLAAFAVAGDIDPQNPQHRTVIDSLLALRAATGAPFADLSYEALTDLACAYDPRNDVYAQEIETRAEGLDWGSYIDALVDASYSAEGAWQRLDADAAHEAQAGGAGLLSHAAIETLAELVQGLMPPETLDLALASGELTDEATLARVLGQLPEHIERTVAIAPGTGRRLARWLTVHGGAIERKASPAALFFARLVPATPKAPPAQGSSGALATLEELVLELEEWQSALVLGPAELLIDPVAGEAELARDALLRSGRVRAIVRLPAGWVPSAVRQSLALWLIGGSQRTHPIAERISAIGDLRGAVISAAGRADLASDLASVTGSPALARAHAFRYLRVLRTSELIAGSGALDARALRATPSLAKRMPQAVELAAQLDRALARHPAAPVRVTSGTATPVTAAALEQLRKARQLRVLAGARIHRGSVTQAAPVTGSYPVVGAHEVRTGAAPALSGRSISRTEFAMQYPRASLTEPGDVIFTAGSHPAAVVDPVGLCVVEYPARVLRLAPGAPLVPELVAADINAAAAGDPWQRWQLRRVPAGQAAALSEALARLRLEREALARRGAELAETERLLAASVVAGITLEPTDFIHSTPDSLTYPTTEGTR